MTERAPHRRLPDWSTRRVVSVAAVVTADPAQLVNDTGRVMQITGISRCRVERTWVAVAARVKLRQPDRPRVSSQMDE